MPDEWELYAPDDWSQVNDLAQEMPGSLRDLQRLWLIEAGKYKSYRWMIAWPNG